MHFTDFKRLKALAMACAVGLGLAVAAPAPAQAQTTQIPVTPDFFEGWIRGDGELGTVYSYRWTLFEQDGRMVLCGAGYLRDARLNTTIRRMARNGGLVTDAQTYPLNLTFFTRVRTLGGLGSAMATCTLTDIPAIRSGSVGLTYEADVFRN
jgi:hypothetical protein